MNSQVKNPSSLVHQVVEHEENICIYLKQVLRVKEFGLWKISKLFLKIKYGID